jgi:plastocyanin
MRLVSLVTLVLLAGASGCGGISGYGSTTGPGGGGHTLSISMSGAAFSPALDTVAAGSLVTWTNNDGVAHNVTAVPGSADTYASSNLAGSGTFSHTFLAAGTYVYYCTIHGTPTAGMRGTIVVQ